MVGTELRTVQWSDVNLTTCRGVNTDRCLNKGLGATCNGISTEGIWSAQEMKNHINVSELLAIKLVIQTFLKTLKHRAIYFQVGNISVKDGGGTQNLKLVQ